MTQSAHSLLIALLLTFSTSAPSLASDYIVNDFGDSGDSSPGDGACATAVGSCTLRAAIVESNAIAGPDRITFAQTDDVVLNNTLLGTIPVTDALTIQGSGNTITAVGLGVTMLDIAGLNAVVELRDLSFSNPSGQGVSIDTGANVLMLDCIVSGNNSGYPGGGILITGGSLLVRACEIRDNTATVGPALWASTGAVVTIENSIIKGNTSTVGSGGAIQSLDAHLEITNTILMSNTAAANGGAIDASGNLTLGPDVVIDDNEALAGDGGGVHYMDVGAQATLDIGVSVISNNKASGNGGGLYYWSGLGIFAATNTALILNDAGAQGGGLYYIHTLSGGPQSFSDGKISGNQAVQGGGTFLAAGQLLTTRTTISDNTAVSDGGGISVNGGSHSLSNATVSNNSAVTGGGIYGGITAATFSVFNTTVYDNLGGGVHTVGGAPIVIFQNSIVGRGPSGSAADCDDGVNAVNPNLDSDGTCGASLTADPQLGPLVLLRGTPMHVPGASSPAAGAGSNAVCAAAPVGGVDQIGSSRPFGANCDLGSVESGAIGFANGFDSGNTSTWSKVVP